MGLREYKRKRNFNVTTEPKGSEKKRARSARLRFVIQEHHATRLHFDFRLEMEGVLRSWAVPKGPSMNPSDKRLAMMVEDHPMEYGSFQGTIPEGNYGAGEVRIWDKGTYEALGDASPEAQVRKGKLEFVMHGKKLKGEFHLFRMRSSKEENAWLLIKIRDKYSDDDWELEQILPYGSRSEKPEGLTSKRVWISNRAQTSKSSTKTTTKSSASKTGSARAKLLAKSAAKRKASAGSSVGRPKTSRTTATAKKSKTKPRAKTGSR